MKDEVNIMEKEKLEQYKNWMCNLSFFNYHSFIIDNIENLWQLTNYIGFSFSKYIDDKYKVELDYSSINLDETINLAQDFFKKHNFNVNIKQMIEDKILILNKNVNKETNSYYGTKKDGISDYDENHNKIVTINLEETIYDSIIIVHELMHYLNQPLDKRSEVSDLLTEAISYSAELIFCEDLKSKKYNQDKELHFKCLEKTTYSYAYNIYYVYKIIYLYKLKGDITEEKYNELYNDDQYLNTMQKYEEYVERRGSIFHDTWYMIGLPLAIYLLEEYRKNSDNIKYIHLLNENINNKSLEECLNMIGINSIDVFKEKIQNSVESFKKLLDDIYLKVDIPRKK